MSGRSVYFGGSRGLSSSLVVRSVVWAALAAGFSVRTGCAIGADSLVISAVLAAGWLSRLAVFAAFGPGGAGALSCSASSLVGRVYRAGAQVVFSSLLSCRPAARLAARSRAALLGSAIACFFLAPGSFARSGSLLAAAAAVRSGIPVYVFSCGFAGAPPALAGLAGFWQRAFLWGFPCWLWSAGQKSILKKEI